MKAIVQDRYGPPDVLSLRDIEMPAAGDGDVLIRVHAAGVNPGDVYLTRGVPYAVRLAFGLRQPRNKIRGMDVAGTVEAVGEKVQQFQPGDEVFGWCKGAFAEYAKAAETNFVPKPPGLTFDQVAAVPIAAFAALQGIRDQGNVRAGQKVLINGASGGVGTFAVQIAKALGAEVTGVCSTKNVDLVRSIGADHVIDYTKEDFAAAGQRYDVILDNVGNRSLADLRRALTPKGTLVPSGNSGGRWIGGLGLLIRARALSPFVGHRLRPFISLEKRADLVELKRLLEEGKITPVIDRTYALSEAVDAVRYVREGHARGKVVITQ